MVADPDLAPPSAVPAAAPAPAPTPVAAAAVTPKERAASGGSELLSTPEQIDEVGVVASSTRSAHGFLERRMVFNSLNF